MTEHSPMDTRDGRSLTKPAGGRRASRRQRAAAAAVLLALLVLCGLFAAAAPAGAFAAPGKPTAKAPTGAIATATPTFTWSKASGAAKYEVRVYQGSVQLLKKAGITRRSWKSSVALPANVDLTWKVRAGSGVVKSAWSKKLTFKVVTASPDKSITAFGFSSPAATGVITEGAHTIAVTVPFGTDVTALVATFAGSGVSVKVGATPQVSGATPNDFTSPVTYTVTAADASTQAYTVTVTAAAAAIGQDYGGGKIAYILQNGDPGYIAGQTHGLIAAAADQSAGIVWRNGMNVITRSTGTALGTGSANTNLVIAVQGAPAGSYAAGLARAYSAGGHNDWYLPSRDELNKLYLNQVAIGGFSSQYYWSSTEFFSDFAWY
jgi:hypothetical protein